MTGWRTPARTHDAASEFDVGLLGAGRWELSYGGQRHNSF